MEEKSLNNIYNVDQYDISENKEFIGIGSITEKEKFIAAKQILFGLALLYIFTVIAYLVRPVEGEKLIDIIMTIFSSLATLILVSYFKNKVN